MKSNLPDVGRRRFLLSASQGALGFALAPHLSCRTNRTSRPNILFIMSDDHASQAMSCYGSAINTTPNLDRIAAEGMRFNRSFCTNAICAPSRATLLTGMYNHLNGQTTNAQTFDGNQITFPQLLQQAGYQTAMVGKWHLKSDPTGFDYWNILPDQGDYYNPDFIEMGQRRRIDGYVTDVTTSVGLQWLSRRNRQQPFCLLLHYKAPHRNWMPDSRHLSLYRDQDIPLPETFYDDYEGRSRAAAEQEMTISRHLWPAFDLKLPDGYKKWQTLVDTRDGEFWRNSYNRMNPSQRALWDAAYGKENEAFRKANLTGAALAEWKYQRYIKDYLRCVASLDDNIGDVLKYLDIQGLADNTLLVYTSDQGFFLGEHGWFDKRFMYEESLRIPLLIRFPLEIKPSASSNDMALNIDFAPTFLDYAGVKAPAEIQGRSLRPILNGSTPGDWRQSIYYHYYEYPAWHMVRPHYGVRTQGHKLIHFYSGTDEWELYDLEKDPHERSNLYNHSDYSEIQMQLKKELHRLQVYYKDPVKS